MKLLLNGLKYKALLYCELLFELTSVLILLRPGWRDVLLYSAKCRKSFHSVPVRLFLQGTRESCYRFTTSLSPGQGASTPFHFIPASAGFDSFIRESVFSALQMVIQDTSSNSLDVY
ncbi:MAG: hypothetical protein B6241_03785 [Spirochaetaceae bacterium 4572_59]|nr:MAG: hypothetical protein B6241_03785 [Spirochaetaceae bacterium 4572_59]